MKLPFRILVIEDDRDTRANLCDILELDGHQVFAAESFNASTAVANAHKIDLVITDRRLPEGLIEEFLPQLKRNSSDAEIIVVTGFGDMHSTITALRLGVADYLIKPIVPDDIRVTVNRIVENRNLQKELAEEHQFAEEVLNTAEAIILVLDLNGNVVRFNPYFEQLTGWSIEELRDCDWFEKCIPEEDRKRIQEVFIATAHDVHTRGVINEVYGKDGRCRRIRWSNTTLKKSDGTAEAVLAIGVDISDLADAETRALQSERLATIGQTMTALAHESRNALQRIKAAGDVLALEFAGNETAEEDLHSIQRASSDLEHLHEEVRSFAAPILLQTTATNLPSLWHRVWSDLAAVRMKRQAQLIENQIGCPSEITIDSIRMEQVFRNLFENSLAACSDPVRIELRYECVGNVFELHYKDNGPGLCSETSRRVFEPFFTTKSTGTGLGMSICQRIIEAHGGTIEATTSEQGASFMIRLPANPAYDRILIMEAKG